MKRINKITTEQQFHQTRGELELLITKGTALGDMELLNKKEKKEFSFLAEKIHEWEQTHFILPLRTSVITKKEDMSAKCIL